MNYCKEEPKIKIGQALDRRTVMLAASSLFIFGSFIGCAVYRFLGIGESELYDNLIERYFLALFYKCEGGLDVAMVVLEACMHELWVFALVFFAGFTLFVPVVSGVFLLYRGLLFGFAVTMLQFSVKTGILLDSLVYLCANLAISALLIVTCTEAVGYYIGGTPTGLRSSRTKNYFLVFLRICALVCADVLLMLFLIYVYI